ncbi:MAG: hypothetical protein ACJ762_17755 [Solirubrobacteraceae bacterium]
MRRHLSPSLVISLLALAVALGGTAYAAVKITGRDVKNGSLTGADVKNRSLHAADLAADAKVAGPAGPAGATGNTGAAGAKGADGANGTNGTNGTNGARGVSAWDTIPSGQTVRGEFFYDSTGTGASVTDGMAINLPALAPEPLTYTTVNFAPGGVATDGDPTCTGDSFAPTAPAGQLCIYVATSNHISTASARNGNLALQTGLVDITSDATSGTDKYLRATWAYTAP